MSNPSGKMYRPMRCNLSSLRFRKKYNSGKQNDNLPRILCKILQKYNLNIQQHKIGKQHDRR
jgi:hypothetical protein